MPIHNKCPLCGSGEIAVLFECTDFLVSGEKFPVSRCTSCSFVFTNNYPPEEKSAEYYRSDEYISHSDTGKGMVNRVYHIARKIMLWRKYRLLKNVSGLNNASVLDIGSGTGYFPMFLRKKGWECQGIEISEEARQYAVTNNNISLFSPGDISRYANSSMDMITMWHTMEHFYHPDEYLRFSHRILKETGVLVIAVPNHLSYDALRYGKLWAAWDVPRHLWHFNPDTIRIMAGKHGFTLKAVRRLPLDAFYVSALSEKHKQSSLAFMRGLITGFISWIHSMLKIRKTSSLVYVFSKDQ
ncbi:MAG: class I SAM-dependent methyltransferase [Spirochaetales bacterium]|jgi:SAM-dependent methyltransferase|nr:class I SAM-dependent methyltransferase [Spirochaetales bacterium]